jgi:(2Fe-2S) ferredoxin
MRHLFVCTNTVGSGKPACGARGGEAVMTAVQQRLLARGITARVTACSCLGPCFDGPNAVVYPDAIWYGGLDAGDADALVDHLERGTVLTTKRLDPPG